MPSKSEQVAKALIVTAEVMGHELSPMAAKAMTKALAGNDLPVVYEALRRCQHELSGRLSLAKVLERIPGGHLGADEAWALCPRSESATVVWTDQIAAAFGAARPLLEEGDQVAARMAFKDAYAREMAACRHQPAQWAVSAGHDVAGRVAAVTAAVELGRLPPARATHYLPPGHDLLQLASGVEAVAEMLPAIGAGK